MEFIKRLNGRKANLIQGTVALLAAVANIFLQDSAPAWLYTLLLFAFGFTCLELAKYKS